MLAKEKEDEFRIELKTSLAITTRDKEKIEFIKNKAISQKDNVLEAIIGDIIIFAIEINQEMYLSKKRELVDKIKDTIYSKMAIRLDQILSKQKEEETIAISTELLQKVINRFERRTVGGVEILRTMYKGEERQILILFTKAYIFKTLIINSLESYMIENSKTKLDHEEVEKYIRENYKVIEFL